MLNRNEFIIAAIEDSQATIRAVDVKVGVLLVGLLAPFSNLGRILAHVTHLIETTIPLIAYGFPAAFFLFWMLALTSLVMSISAIDNPAKHIASSSKFKGSFYGGGLYKFSFLDSIINRDTVKAEKDTSEFSKSIPSSEKEIESELIFEHMKIIYIREIKLLRLKYSYRFSVVWFTLGLIIYFISKAS